MAGTGAVEWKCGVKDGQSYNSSRRCVDIVPGDFANVVEEGSYLQLLISDGASKSRILL